jgi:transcriptional regulator GlxA family with amidase domain
MRALGRIASAADLETITRLQEHGLDVLATALRDADATRRDAATSPARQAQLAHVQSFIRRHLGDPALSAQIIADASGLSVRTVYGLFAAEASTPGRWIQGARLEACRRDLEDPLQARRSITDVAFARGFNDAAHFSRVFRAKFGTSPRAWSAAHRRK